MALLQRLLLLVVTAAFLGAVPQTGIALPWKAVPTFIKHAGALTNSEIDELAKLASEINGTKKVGQRLGQQKLPDQVLTDAYLRIAVHRGKIDPREAQLMMDRLEGVQGFRSTLSKVIGNSDAKSAGHLNELRIAARATDHRFNVDGIGVRFNDGKKRAETDIDVLLSRNQSQVAIEAKDYLPSTPIAMDSFRADMVSLVEYAKASPNKRTILVFSMTNKPADQNTLVLLTKEAHRRGIELVFGGPDDLMKRIHLVERYQ